MTTLADATGIPMPTDPPAESITVRIQVDIFHHFPDGIPTSLVSIVTSLIAQMESRIMAALDDAIKTLTTSVNGAVTRVTTDLATLNTEIQALQAQVANGGGTPAQLAAISALQAQIDALDPTPVPPPA